jgi:hypothetical protein
VRNDSSKSQDGATHSCCCRVFTFVVEPIICQDRLGTYILIKNNSSTKDAAVFPQASSDGIAANFGSEFGWPSADIMSVTATITPPGEGWLQYEEGGQRGSSPFLQYRNQIKNPDWLVDSMLFPNATLVQEFPSRLGPQVRERTKRNETKRPRVSFSVFSQFIFGNNTDGLPRQARDSRTEH